TACSLASTTAGASLAAAAADERPVVTHLPIHQLRLAGPASTAGTRFAVGAIRAVAADIRGHVNPILHAAECGAQGAGSSIQAVAPHHDRRQVAPLRSIQVLPRASQEPGIVGRPIT